MAAKIEIQIPLYLNTMQIQIQLCLYLMELSWRGTISCGDTKQEQPEAEERGMVRKGDNSECYYSGSLRHVYSFLLSGKGMMKETNDTAV